MLTEQVDLELLKGESVLKVISQLPTYPWCIKDGQFSIPVKMSYIEVVDYDLWKPRSSEDIFGHISVTPSMPIPESTVLQNLKAKQGKTTGLISLVGLDQTEFEEGCYGWIKQPRVHLPLIDIDINDQSLSFEEAIELIKQEVPLKTEIARGVILSSGAPNHFHFIGVGRLLSEDQFVTFMGLCLNMTDNKGNQIVDAKWAGHALTPMKYMTDLNKEEYPDWSYYDIQQRFATLRVLPNIRKPYLPKVVDIL